jgi:alpha-galactosidase
MTRLLLLLALVAETVVGARNTTSGGSDGGVAAVPPLGWDSGAALGCAIDEAVVRATIDSIAQHLRPAGFEYVVLSDCVFPRGSRDPSSGVLIPDAVRFPSGIAALASYARSRGLRLGLGTDVGEATCAGYEGSLGHERLDAEAFSLWGVELVVARCCGAAARGREEELFQRMGAALSTAGSSPMVYHVVAPGLAAWKWARHFSNAWYIGSSLLPSSPTWAQLLANLDLDGTLASIAGPGGWNDLGPLAAGAASLTREEWVAQMALWAVSAAPLFVGCDVRPGKVAPLVLQVLANPDVVQVDQDKLGAQGLRVYDDGHGRQVWAKKLSTTKPADRAVACALFNRASTPLSMTVTYDMVGLMPSSPAFVRDLVNRVDVGPVTSGITAVVPPHSVAFYQITQTIA